MRVAIFADQLLYRVPGGIATYIRCLARELIRQDPRDEFLLFHCGRKGQRVVGAPEGMPQARIPGGRAALSLSWNYLGMPRTESFLGSLDLIHATQLIVPATEKPLVGTVHDIFVISHPESFPPLWRRLLQKGLEVMLRKARLLIAVSESTADDLRSILRPGDDRVRVVPQGVEVPPATPPQAVRAVRERQGLPECYFINVGTREPRKNLDRLVDAFQLAREYGGLPGEVGLALVGPPGWGMEELEKRAAASAGVKVLGYVTEEELDLLLKGSLALVYPSLAEGFGLPVLEAMVRGVPVITSDTSALREIAGGAALLVDPGDVVGLAEAMAEIYEKEERREELSRLGRERAALYTWEKTARLTLQAYEEAVS